MMMMMMTQIRTRCEGKNERGFVKQIKYIIFTQIRTPGNIGKQFHIVSNTFFLIFSAQQKIIVV